MLVHIDVKMTYNLPARASVLLAVQSIASPDQRLVRDNLIVDGAEPMRSASDLLDHGTRTWFAAQGQVDIAYTAEVEVERGAANLHDRPLSPLVDLPAEAAACLFPSRYCESDRLALFVSDQFGPVRDGSSIEAMADWIHGHVTYQPGSSNVTTSAVDTLLTRRGVCRDFAHLMIAFARAAQIPARAVSVYAPGLAPQDFHAVTEVFLDGAWHLVDASRLADPRYFVRMATGRDATDISFMTIFGTAHLIRQDVRAEFA